MKNIFKLVIFCLISSHSIQNTAFNNPLGLQNGRGVCYANAALQLIMATPKIEQFIKNLDDSSPLKQNLKAFYRSYRKNQPDNNIKLEIIKEVMGEKNMSTQCAMEFLSKLFEKLGYTGFPTNNNAIYNKLGVKPGNGPNHIANLVHTGGHYFTEIKSNDQWYKIDDGTVTKITEPNHNFTISIALVVLGEDEVVGEDFSKNLNYKQFLINYINHETDTLDDFNNLYNIKPLLKNDDEGEAQAKIKSFQDMLRQNPLQYFDFFETVVMLNDTGKEKLSNFLSENIKLNGNLKQPLIDYVCNSINTSDHIFKLRYIKPLLKNDYEGEAQAKIKSFQDMLRQNSQYFDFFGTVVTLNDTGKEELSNFLSENII